MAAVEKVTRLGRKESHGTETAVRIQRQVGQIKPQRSMAPIRAARDWSARRAQKMRLAPQEKMGEEPDGIGDVNPAVRLPVHEGYVGRVTSASIAAGEAGRAAEEEDS